jgi:SAM-dependent methyltransferase
MPTPSGPDADRDYVLGTHDAEVERLAFQHDVWRENAHSAWRRAGVVRGSRVVDIGAGPGFATLDLAEIVGAEGRVLAVERSGRFADLLRGETARRKLGWVDVVEADLMHDPIGIDRADMAWCRWVACFVSDPALLVRRIAASLRRGGSAVFHEYVEYGSYQLLPDGEPIDGFVDAVFESWRHQGGEPDIARSLPRLIGDAGLEITSARPIVFAATPGERLWNWPAGFVKTNVPRLVELGVRSPQWGASVLDRLERAESDPRSIFITPTVLEIIATLP